MSVESFFNKISQVTRNELVDFMEHNKIELTIKLLNQFIKTNVLSKKNDSLLSIQNIGSHELINKSATCLFHVGDEKYFFKSHINTNNSNWTIEVPAEIFQLQRRNDYRASMPMGLVYKSDIVFINGVKSNIKTEIRDMSLGGCQISITGTDSEIKKNDEIDLYLKLDKYEFQRLPLVARHIKHIESQNTSLIGASLHEPDSDLLSELQSMLMYLNRVHRGKAE